ncbi:hypothetical protein H0H81_003053 [Sphagnurus paluster]|uniref:Uncharacterized protein n=1 Tax=Sphagnurus paluster TaxID=117069 RepID=A0A9P7GFG7_9AGAR|nr:hypothetical protein H0H81_003053 [Sphagnurus paluster]
MVGATNQRTRASRKTTTSASDPSTATCPDSNPAARAPKKRGGRPKKTPETETETSTVTPHTTQASEDRAPSPSGVPDPNPAVDMSSEEKDKEIERLRALLAAGKGTQTPSTENVATITPIVRPKGEAGDKKRGFVLRDAMELSGSREERAMYAAIVTHSRRSCTRVGLDLEAKFRCQDPEKLGKVFKLNRAAFPYLTKKRFPGDWASAEIVKLYLRGQRKSTRRKLKQRSLPNISDLEDEEDEEMVD